jgi:L-alanine-DL-glutamate epimerase-like enolase superfamily enzyme
MNITNIRACQPHRSTAPNDWRGSLGQILVRVDTDDGLSGYGIGAGGFAGIHVVETELRSFLIGREADDIETRWQELYELTRPYGQRGLAVMALSGVDLALWDLRAKRAGVPVAGLLGNRWREPVPGYWMYSEPELQHLGGVVASGFRAVKLSIPIGSDATDIVNHVRQARDVLGPDVRLMIDAEMIWDVDGALNLADRLAPYDLDWMEGILRTHSVEELAAFVARSPIALAGGEHEYTSEVFVELIERHAFDIYQPDIAWCGGLSEVVKIFRMANEAGVRVCLHRGAEVWGLHAIAGLDPHPLAESGRPWIDWVDGQPTFENGSIRIAENAGFGVQFDPAIWHE